LVEEYVPERGDIVWLTHDPQAGHEQAGRRPSLVISPALYNRAAGLMLCIPITSRQKGYDFEVVLPDACPIQGVVLADQLRSLDYRARRAVFECRCPQNVLQEAIAKAKTLLGP
jgi:mRNA interferase MazF